MWAGFLLPECIELMTMCSPAQQAGFFIAQKFEEYINWLDGRIWDAEAAGSSPASSTHDALDKRLSRLPFKEKTRVRTPYALQSPGRTSSRGFLRLAAGVKFGHYALLLRNVLRIAYKYCNFDLLRQQNAFRHDRHHLPRPFPE